MNNDINFIKSEKDIYGKILVDINYAIDNVSPFLDPETLKNRKYYLKKDSLKKYIDLLNSAESEVNSKKSFLNMFKKGNCDDLLKSFKKDNEENLTRLKNCSKCACLNCIKDCKFNSCLGCRPNSYIKKCDKEKLNVSNHENFVLTLTNNNTNTQNRYKVLSTLNDCELDRQYIVIQNVLDSSEKFVLYYYPGISEDTYGEITDTEEFDLIVGTFESKDL